MTIWKNCTADIFYYDGSPAITDDEGYIVRFTDGRIEIAYDDDAGAVCYKGEDNGSGHYELTAREREGHASLHCFPGGRYLEGYWREGATRGMWRILLQ